MNNEPADSTLSLAPDRKIQPAPVPPDALALLRLAVENKTPVDVMERLLAMQERMQAGAAKAAYDDALAAFQEECPTIIKTVAGYKNAYKFAPLDHIVGQVRPLLRKHGFSYTITAEVAQGWVEAKLKITHVQGHSDVTSFKCPIDGNAKNLMSDPQRYGAAMTFAKRYAFCNGFGILTADQDIDGGPGARPEPRFGPQGGPQGGQRPSEMNEPPDDHGAPFQPDPEPPAPSTPAVKALKQSILAAARPKFKFPAQGVAESAEFMEFKQWLYDDGILNDTEDFSKLSETRLKSVLGSIQNRIK